jgi:hypothetical protein
MSKRISAVVAALGVALMVTLLLLPGTGSAAPTDTIKLKPVAGRFGNAPDYKSLGNSTGAQGQWTNKQALDGKFSVLLEKSVPTSDFAYAAAIVDGAAGHTVAQIGTMGFSVKGNCGGGSPRFNLFYDNDADGAADGVAFYGCGNHVSGSPAPGWTSMSVDSATPDAISPFNAAGAALTPASVVTSLSVLVDEQGTYYVDRVMAMGQTTGEPNAG